MKAKPENMETRVKQTLKLTQFFATNRNFLKVPVILAGDFNEEPQNKPIKDIMESSFIDIFTLHKLQEKILSKDQKDNYPAFTTHKSRDESGWVTRTIDYMFMAENEYFNSNKVIVEEVLDTLDRENDLD